MWVGGVSLDCDTPLHVHGRTEYWVSRDKHFCETCKIWIDGNKQSILLHKNGRRHSENVKMLAKKQRTQGEEEKKEEMSAEDVTKELERIEEAAREQYAKDMAARVVFSAEPVRRHHPSTSHEVPQAPQNTLSCPSVLPQSNHEDYNSHYALQYQQYDDRTRTRPIGDERIEEEEEEERKDTPALPPAHPYGEWEPVTSSSSQYRRELRDDEEGDGTKAQEKGAEDSEKEIADDDDDDAGLLEWKGAGSGTCKGARELVTFKKRKAGPSHGTKEKKTQFRGRVVY